MAEQKSTVHNNLANTKRMLAGLIVKQKDDIQRLEKLLAEYEKVQSKELKLLEVFEQHPNHEKQARKVADINQKVAATEEAIAQYKANLLELGVKL